MKGDLVMKRKVLFPLLFALCLVLSACSSSVEIPDTGNTYISIEDVPDYTGAPYCIIADNKPNFTESDLTTESFERYSDLDRLGRCGVAYANIGKDLMPTEERGSIGMIKPTGWHTVKYDSVDGKYLYNRCHLIGYQLTAENANEKNLITGTRYMNVEGMLPFENMIADYVKETGNHVLYRVTPIFMGDNLLANGVQMEAMSVEDQGHGIEMNVYVYNSQPGVGIDYTNGNSWIENSSTTVNQSSITYILNTNTHRFHTPSCPSIQDMKAENKEMSYSAREELISEGYKPCGNCRP